MLKELKQFLSGLDTDKVRNYVAPGLDSHMFTGAKLRMFVNTRPQEYFITPHSHRYDLFSVVLSGTVKNTMYTALGPEEEHGDRYAVSVIRPDGRFKYIRVGEPNVSRFHRWSEEYGQGDHYIIEHGAIHSIEFSDGAEVLLLESPSKAEKSVILEPTDRLGKPIKTFIVEPWMFQGETA